MSIIAWILLGLVAGWLAGQVTHGGGYGILGDVVLIAFAGAAIVIANSSPVAAVVADVR